MNSVAVLVDFDNYVKLNNVPGQKPKQHHVDIAMDHLIKIMVDWAGSLTYLINEIYFKVYGGWYSNDDQQSKSDLRLMLDSYCHHAKKSGRIRIKLEVAESIIADSTKIFKNSYQKHQFFLPITTEIISKCLKKDDCLTKLVKDWQENGCSGCIVSHEEILTRKLQKTVDTSIVCDIIYLSHSKLYKCICLVSADYDMVPGVVYGLSEGAEIFLFRIDKHNDYDKLITNCQIINYTPQPLN